MKSSTVAASCLVVVLVWLSPALAGPLEGRWRLVEQKLGDGEAEHLPAPLAIEFVREGARLAGRLHVGRGGAEHVVAWPALPTEAEPSPVRVLELSVPEAEDRIRVHYRTDATAEDGASIDIVEQYRVADGGRSLVGTVTIGVPGGGAYHLRRRFERVP